MSEFPENVFVIDDDEVVAESLVEPLGNHKINIYDATNINKAFSRIRKNFHEVIIIELEYGPLPGLAIIQKLREAEDEKRQCAGMILACGRPLSTADNALITELQHIETVSKPIIYASIMPAIMQSMKNSTLSSQILSVTNQCFQLVAKDINQALTHCTNNQHILGKHTELLIFELLAHYGAHDQAIDQANRLMELNPDDTATLNSIGIYLFQKEKMDQAKELLERADHIAPRQFSRISTLANLYIKENSPDAAAQKIREIVRLHPESPETVFEFFHILANAGYKTHAAELCHEFSTPTAASRYFFNLGHSFQESGNISSALAGYQNALDCYPNFRENYRLLFEIAQIEITKRTPEGFLNAEIALERCIRLFPFNKKARQLLAAVRKKINRKHKIAG